jgi:beta-galactosidase GanA
MPERCCARASGSFLLFRIVIIPADHNTIGESLLTTSTDLSHAPHLHVGGRPFIVIGAEVHNSSSSTERAIESSFDTIARLGANTVLAPVAWDLFEPVEGTFDTHLLDAMVEGARARGLKLIPLWFGSWKNAASTYVPTWVKADPERFPRSLLSNGRHAEHLTPFASTSRDADARAFATMMRRISHIDTAGTVIAVQVENEIGLLGDSRDRSAHAERLFADRVPASVIHAIAEDADAPLHQEWLAHGSRSEGAWAQVFPAGDRTDEAFMAWGFAAYTQVIAAAGRAELDVPLFVNAWLDRDSVLDGPVALAGGKRPGQYPSGGPVLPVAAIWEEVAPAIDFLAPDMYVDDATPVFVGFKARRGRLFIPELRADAAGIPQMFEAIGDHAALGVSPFGVDSYHPEDAEWGPLSDAYRLLRAAAAVVAQKPDARMRAIILSEQEPSAEIALGDVTVTLHTKDEWGYVTPTYPGYAIVIDDGADAVYLIGRGFWITLAGEDGTTASFLSATAFELEGDELVPTHHLNGDETASGSLIPFPFAGSGLVPGRPIPTRIPDTGIVRFSVYGV